VTENGAAPAPRASTKEKAQTAVPFVVASGLLRIIVSLVGLLLLVRYLPQEEYGVWVLLTGLAIPLGLFTSLGFQQSLMRFMPALPDGPPRAERLWAVIGGRLALATCASLALTMSFSWIAPRFGLDEHLASFLAVQPGIVLMCVTVYATAGLNVAFRQREAFIAAFVQQTLFLATVAGGIGTGQGLIYFAGAYSVTSAAHLAVSLAYCVRVYGRPRLGELARRPSEPGEEVRYRRTSYVNEVAGSFLSPDISRYLLAAFSTTLEVAVYAVATSIVLRLRSFQPMEIFRPLATVSVFERFEQTGRVDELNKSFRFLYTANHLVTAFYVALFLPLGAQTLAWVFRDEYVSSYLPALFFFLSLALFGMPVGLLAHALRRPQFLIYSKAAVLVNVGLGIPLSIRYGASGMAFATMLSVLAGNTLTFVLLRLEFDVRFPWSTFARFLVAGAAAGGASWLALDLTSLPVAALVGSLVYGLAVRFARVMTNWERDLLVSLVPARLRASVRLLVGH
jgi:O-antigen/teichoic acid export membrane protein